MKTRVGRKEYIILPKAIREAVGIDEGDEVIIEVRDGIVIKPVKKKINPDITREKLRVYVNRLRRVKGRRKPKAG